MPGKVDLTLAPWAELDSTVAKAHAIYRDSPFSLTLRFWTDATKTVGVDLSAGSFQAQIRKARLSAGVTTVDPLVEFAIDDTDAADGVLVLNLTRTETRDLALKAGDIAFWDVQDDTSGDTLMTGKIKVFDDVNRP